PGRSASSESFIAVLPRFPACASFIHHAHQVADPGDHAAGHGGVGQFLDPADLVEPEADQGLALDVMAPRRASGLLDLHGFPLVGHVAKPLAQSLAASASPSRRRACRAETLMPRRAATARGESWCLSASKVARTML